MIEKLVGILTTLTEESQKAALASCAEKGFDINRGIVTLDESFINLTSLKNILTDAIQKNKLIQLPISIQTGLLIPLEAISNSLTNLVNGIDEVENLSKSIEQLNVQVWQYGLYNISDEVLGYTVKMNQLKQQEVEIARIRRELQLALEEKQQLENLLERADVSTKTILEYVALSEDNSNKTKDCLQNTSQINEKASAIFATIEQNDNSSTQLLSSTKVSSAEVLALESKIKEFYSQVDQYRLQMNTIGEDGKKYIEGHRDATGELVKNLKMLEGQIKDQIEKATGFSLFHSFQTRQHELSSSKKSWVWALGILVLASWGISIFVLETTSSFDVAFFGKLSMTIPLIYAIFFCTVQYGRERKLEEEYAFKSNISISLMPYQELVEKLVDSKQDGERQKFTAFLIETITKVYTSPTDKVFETDHKTKGSTIEPMLQLEKIIKSIVDPLKPIFELVKK